MCVCTNLSITSPNFKKRRTHTHDPLQRLAGFPMSFSLAMSSYWIQPLRTLYIQWRIRLLHQFGDLASTYQISCCEDKQRVHIYDHAEPSVDGQEWTDDGVASGGHKQSHPEPAWLRSLPIDLCQIDFLLVRDSATRQYSWIRMNVLFCCV